MWPIPLSFQLLHLRFPTSYLIQHANHEGKEERGHTVTHKSSWWCTKGKQVTLNSMKLLTCHIRTQSASSTLSTGLRNKISGFSNLHVIATCPDHCHWLIQLHRQLKHEKTRETFCNIFHMVQHVNLPTHSQGNIFDLTFKTSPTIQMQASCIPGLELPHRNFHYPAHHSTITKRSTEKRTTKLQMLGCWWRHLWDIWSHLLAWHLSDSHQHTYKWLQHISGKFCELSHSN